MAKRSTSISKKRQHPKIIKKEFFEKRKNLVLIIAMLCLAIYGNTIRNEYSIDDVFVTNNEQVKNGFSAIPEILTSLYATNLEEDGRKIMFGYRPVVKTSFAIENGIFGENPHVSHFINIILYFLLCLLIFNFLIKVFNDKDYLVPFLITLLFAANPLHTEVVASLKNRDELLATLFGFMALHKFLSYGETKKILNVLYGFIFFVLAYYSKLSAIVFIALIPLTLYFFTKLKFKNIALVFGVLAVAYVGIRLFNRSFLPGSFRPKQYIENPLVFMEMSERLPTVFYILIFYLKKIILPFPLLFYYGYNTIEIQGWGSLWVIISILVHLSLIIIAIMGIKKKSIYSFGILFYLMVIAMYSNILRPPMGIVADRFLFVAVLPFSIIVVYGVKQIFLKTKSKISLNKRLLYFGIAVLLIHSIITIDRNKDWYNQETLVTNDIGKLKKSARANFIYAGMLKVELYDKIKKYQQNPLPSEVEKIKLYLNRAIDVYPEYYEAWDMLGTIHHVLDGNTRMAIVCFEKAISINPNYIKSYQNLAFVYSRNGKNEKALEILEEAYSKRPFNKTTILDLIDVNKALNDSSQVEFYAEKLRAAESHDAETPRARRKGNR